MSRHTTPLNPTRRGFGALALGTLAAAGTASALGSSAAQAAPAAPNAPAAGDGPQPTPHTQQAYDPITSDFHARWTRADARQIMRTQNDTSVARGENSMPESITVPEIPRDFPIMTDEVWVWDTWSLTDEYSNQMSYKGWDVIFSLVAPRDIPFDERHWSARIGYFTRPSSAEPDEAWTYGGYLFEDETSLSNTEWSGSARLMQGNKVRVFYTATTFGEKRPGTDGKPAVLATVLGKIKATKKGVSFSDFGEHIEIAEPDGTWYQTQEQNEYFSFRDPFTFEDPATPGITFMLFEGCGAGVPGTAETDATAEDLGYVDGDPFAETVDEVNAKGVQWQRGNIGLAWADSKDLTSWTMLPPILTAYGVNDQTERPQMIIEDGKYFLFTISHQFTYAADLRGPDGVYGFVGDGIRSDFQPLNSSGVVLGSPVDLNLPADAPESPTEGQNPRQFQAYSHYIQPGGLVQSFIDNVEGRRGGTLSPTVKVDVDGATATSAVDYSFGDNGLGPYAYLPTNKRKGGVGHYK